MKKIRYLSHMTLSVGGEGRVLSHSDFLCMVFFQSFCFFFFFFFFSGEGEGRQISLFLG